MAISINKTIFYDSGAMIIMYADLESTFRN